MVASAGGPEIVPTDAEGCGPDGFWQATQESAATRTVAIENGLANNDDFAISLTLTKGFILVPPRAWSPQIFQDLIYSIRRPKGGAIRSL
ncbi:MAG: hypothetical protein C5B49_04245 [Bdellovibrio sp.]|nr:MAG: hypothetical protein C5B49_04245 [Bdellovibrio sp.]